MNQKARKGIRENIRRKIEKVRFHEERIFNLRFALANIIANTDNPDAVKLVDMGVSAEIKRNRERIKSLKNQIASQFAKRNRI